jgi:hypothetical protein
VPSHDSTTFALPMLTGSPANGESGLRVGTDPIEQVLEVPVAVVLRDVVMDVLPESFDPVLFRTVRREEVQVDLLPARPKEGLDQPALVDDVLVEIRWIRRAER